VRREASLVEKKINPLSALTSVPPWGLREGLRTTTDDGLSTFNHPTDAPCARSLALSLRLERPFHPSTPSRRLETPASPPSLPFSSRPECSYVPSSSIPTHWQSS
jgi:hypothetical protein